MFLINLLIQPDGNAPKSFRLDEKSIKGDEKLKVITTIASASATLAALFN